MFLSQLIISFTLKSDVVCGFIIILSHSWNVSNRSRFTAVKTRTKHQLQSSVTGVFWFVGKLTWSLSTHLHHQNLFLKVGYFPDMTHYPQKLVSVLMWKLLCEYGPSPHTAQWWGGRRRGVLCAQVKVSLPLPSWPLCHRHNLFCLWSLSCLVDKK